MCSTSGALLMERPKWIVSSKAAQVERIKQRYWIGISESAKAKQHKQIGASETENWNSASMKHQTWKGTGLSAQVKGSQVSLPPPC